jgi:hypothetical protein
VFQKPWFPSNTSSANRLMNPAKRRQRTLGAQNRKRLVDVFIIWMLSQG